MQFFLCVDKLYSAAQEDNVETKSSNNPGEKLLEF